MDSSRKKDLFDVASCNAFKDESRDSDKKC